FGSVTRAPACARRRSRSDGPDVRRRRHDVVVPLLRLAVRVRLDVEGEPEAIDLQRIDVAEAEVPEVRDELSVEPDRDAISSLAGCVRLHDVLVVVPAARRGDDVGPFHEIRPKIEGDAGVRVDEPGGKEVVAVLGALLGMVDVDIELAWRR